MASRIFVAVLLYSVHAGCGVSLARTVATASHSASLLATTVPVTQAQRVSTYTLPPDVHRKAHKLSRIRLASRAFGVVYSIFMLWLLLALRWSAQFRNWAEAASGRRIVQVLIYAPLLILTIVILQLPLDVFDEYILKGYGISVQTWPSWIWDWTMLQIIFVVLGTILTWILYGVIRRSPRRWWLVFWGVSLLVMLFVFFIEPVAIDPLFYRFEPLTQKAPQLIPDLQRVIHRAGMEIPPERMFWMEASTKTIVPNAYVTGFGATKRVVIWDTTIAQETTEGLLTLFGHELGHYVLGHVWKSLAFSSMLALALFYLVYHTIDWLLARHGTGWGVRGLEDWASLPALLLLLAIFGFFATVLNNSWNRYLENQADIFSMEVTHGIVSDPGQASAISYQKYGEKVFSDPDPNPLGAFFFADHPTVADRIHLFVTYDPWSKNESPQFVK